MSIEFIIAGFLIVNQFFVMGPGSQDFPKSFDQVQALTAANRTCNRLIENPKIRPLKPRELIKKFGEIEGDLFAANELTPTQKLIFKGVNFNEFFRLLIAICATPEKALQAGDSFDIAKVNKEYSSILSEVGDVQQYRYGQLPGISYVKDRNGEAVGEVYGKEARRVWVDYDDVPDTFVKAVLAAEDQRFFKHNGIDETALLRAFTKSFMGGRLEGGSTITQQLAKNLFTGNAISLRRKFIEMATAFKMERELGKKRILELYMNILFMGVNTWGLDLASQTYFSKKINELTLSEQATLAGTIRWARSKNPILQPQAAKVRRDQVLDAMLENGFIDSSTYEAAKRETIVVRPKKSKANDDRYKYFLSAANYRNKSNAESLEITMDAEVQDLAVQALRNGLEKFEAKRGKSDYRGPVSNILASKSKAVAKTEKKAGYSFLNDVVDTPDSAKPRVDAGDSDSATGTASAVTSTGVDAKSDSQSQNELTLPADWQAQLAQIKLPSASLDWEVAVVKGPNGELGFADDAIASALPSRLVEKESNLRKLKYGDVVYVKKQKPGEYSLAQKPDVDGGVIVMDVHTGEVLAMVGGYVWTPNDEFNRATMAARQPGSLVKPFTYMAALQAGYQPNQVVQDLPMNFIKYGRTWKPRNFDHTSRGSVYLRYGLERSLNNVAVYLMSELGLGPITDIMKDFGVYDKPLNENSVVLGTQETNLMRLTRAYAQIANGGKSLDYVFLRREAQQRSQGSTSNKVDATTLMQIRGLLQGVVQRGTAASLQQYGYSLAGKTGTTNDSRDAWFIGFTPDIVIGVYVGYDQPKSLSSRGAEATGSSVALPIFTEVFESLLANKKIELRKEGFPFIPGAQIEMHEVPLMTRYARSGDDKPTIIDMFRTGYFDPLQRVEFYAERNYPAQQPETTPTDDTNTNRSEPNSQAPHTGPNERPRSRNSQNQSNQEKNDDLEELLETIRQQRERQRLRREGKL